MTQNPMIDKIFEFGGEGGVICIVRQKNSKGQNFILLHNEFDPTEEGLDINEIKNFPDFEQSFQLIENKYPWHKLSILHVHNDFKDIIAGKLIAKLNKEQADQNSRYDYYQLESLLNIKLIFDKNKKPKWDYQKVVDE